MWPAVPRIIHTLEKPVTELRNPIWDLKWSVMAFLSHFALGYLLGLLTASLIMLVSWYFKAKKMTGSDLDLIWSKRDSSTFFERVRNWIEKVCLGRSLVGDSFPFALRVAFWSAVVANLIDVDHALLSYGGPDRIFHPLVFVLAALVFIYCGARMIWLRTEYSIRRYTFWFCLALSLVVHVVEDYTLGWF